MGDVEIEAEVETLVISQLSSDLSAYGLQHFTTWLSDLIQCGVVLQSMG
jgi:hypothetical protein